MIDDHSYAKPFALYDNQLTLRPIVFCRDQPGYAASVVVPCSRARRQSDPAVSLRRVDKQHTRRIFDNVVLACDWVK